MADDCAAAAAVAAVLVTSMAAWPARTERCVMASGLSDRRDIVTRRPCVRVCVRACVCVCVRVCVCSDLVGAQCRTRPYASFLTQRLIHLPSASPGSRWLILNFNSYI